MKKKERKAVKVHVVQVRLTLDEEKLKGQASTSKSSKFLSTSLSLQVKIDKKKKNIKSLVFFEDGLVEVNQTITFLIAPPSGDKEKCEKTLVMRLKNKGSILGEVSMKLHHLCGCESDPKWHPLSMSSSARQLYILSAEILLGVKVLDDGECQSSGEDSLTENLGEPRPRRSCTVADGFSLPGQRSRSRSLSSMHDLLGTSPGTALPEDPHPPTHASTQQHQVTGGTPDAAAAACLRKSLPPSPTRAAMRAVQQPPDRLGLTSSHTALPPLALNDIRMGDAANPRPRGDTIFKAAKSPRGGEDNLDNLAKMASMKVVADSKPKKADLIGEIRKRITGTTNHAKLRLKKEAAFRELFELPESETLLNDFSAAYVEIGNPILLYGRLYASNNYLCFYSNVFDIQTRIKLHLDNIVNMVKKTVLELGVLITTQPDPPDSQEQEYFFTFMTKDGEATFNALHRAWKREASNPEDPQKSTTEDDDGSNDESYKAFLSDPNTCADVAFLNNIKQFDEMVSVEVSCTPMKFFKLFLADESSFLQEYHSNRKDTELTIDKWEVTPNHGPIRKIKYRAPVHATFGPPTTIVNETQRYCLQTKIMRLETISLMKDIPFGDYFSVEAKWEVVEKTRGTSQLTISSGVFFSKSTVFKGKITSQTLKESRESYKLLVQLAQDQLGSARTTTTTTTKRGQRSMSMGQAGVRADALREATAPATPRCTAGETSSAAGGVAHLLPMGGVVAGVLVLLALLHVLFPDAHLAPHVFMAALAVLVVIQWSRVASLEARVLALENAAPNR